MISLESFLKINFLSGVIGALIAIPIVSSLYVVLKFLTGRDPDHPYPPVPPGDQPEPDQPEQAEHRDSREPQPAAPA